MGRGFITGMLFTVAGIVGLATGRAVWPSLAFLGVGLAFLAIWGVWAKKKIPDVSEQLSRPPGRHFRRSGFRRSQDD